MRCADGAPVTRGHVTPGAVVNLVARLNALGNARVSAVDPVEGDGGTVERVRVVLRPGDRVGQRYGGAATVQGTGALVVRIRAL